MLRFAILTVCLFASGCATSQPPPETSLEMIRRWQQEDTNADQIRALLESGDIHPGQSVEEFLRLCTPSRIDFVDHFALIECYAIPGYRGLSLVAADRKLVSATDWSCQTLHVYFDTMTETERQAADRATVIRTEGGWQ